MLTESVIIQPLVSVTVYKYVFAVRAKGSTPYQFSVYGLVPPLIVSIAVPLFPP